VRVRVRVRVRVLVSVRLSVCLNIVRVRSFHTVPASLLTATTGLPAPNLRFKGQGYV
jgi:hypothetical protein